MHTGWRSPAHDRPHTIARTLTVEGWLSADGAGFTAAKVRATMVRMGLPLRGLSLSAEIARHDDELTVAELAHRRNRPLGTLYGWIRSSWLPMRRVHASYRDMFLVRLADAQALVEKQYAVAKAAQTWTPPVPQTAP